MNEFQDINKLWLALGSFAELTSDVKDLIQLIITVEQQTEQEKAELFASSSRHDIPVFRKKLWLPLKITHTLDTPAYDSGDFFDRLGTYDMQKGTTTVYLPDYIVSADYASDGINTQSFRAPVVNRTLNVPKDITTVWLHNALVDRNDLYHQFGYAIGIKLPSSEQYKQLLNALFDTLVNGPSYRTMMMSLSAITGIPVVINNCNVTRVDGHTVYTNDGQVYELPEESSITVKEGDSLQPGDTLCDGLEVTTDVPGITLDRQFTGLCDTVAFINQPEAINVSEEDGFTRVDIPSLGKDFNDRTHQLGIEHSSQITDDCELFQVRKLLGKYQETPEKIIHGGLTSYTVKHRFA